MPYASESQITHQYNSGEPTNMNVNLQTQQYPSIKDLTMPEIPAGASANSNYYPQYPAHQQYNPHLVLQQQASAPISDYHTSSSQVQPTDQQYDSNQATYVQPAQHQQQVYLHHQHHVNIPGSAYSEQSFVVGDDKNAPYAQASSYSQPLPPEYNSQPMANAVSSSKPKKTVILAIPVKLVAKNKYSGMVFFLKNQLIN